MSLTTPTAHGDAAALALLVEQRWSARHTARHLGVAYQSVEELVSQCGGLSVLPHALARARAGHDPRVFIEQGVTKGDLLDAYLTDTHPLAGEVAKACTPRSTRPFVGGVGCGQCWERVIAAGVLSDLRRQQLGGDGR